MMTFSAEYKFYLLLGPLGHVVLILVPLPAATRVPHLCSCPEFASNPKITLKPFS